MDKERFIQALEENSMELLKHIPKSDLHSHAGRGGSVSYIEDYANVKIAPPSEPFNSLSDMNQWLNDHVKIHCPSGLSGYLKRVEAAYAQAKEDGISALALSYAMDEVDAFGSVQHFISVMDGLHAKFAPDTACFPDLALGYSPDVAYELERLDDVLSARWFAGIDICNYAGRHTMKTLRRITEKAQQADVVCKAHIGEFGGCEDVLRYANELQLDQIQHGIAAADSPYVMRYLSDHGIQLNVCPTSNILLKNSKSYQSHQIRTLYDHGVLVTINTDDLLIFNSSVSQEYLKLFQAGLMTAEELNTIRKTGLGYPRRRKAE